ncbi:MAG: hypothetical protein HRU17_23505 [Polyangiaceae bacterium]|nr:hypothetical protein [Polyangiaceae bacterium]
MLDRRDFLRSLGLVAGASAAPGIAQATVSRAVSVTELLHRSSHSIVGTPLGSTAQWEEIGGHRRIVTFTTVRVEQTVNGGQTSETEVVVRTLGGRVGEIGQLVHGEAALIRGKASVMFLAPSRRSDLYVTAMSQGHYPLLADSQDLLRLHASPVLPELRRFDDAAVQQLPGNSLLQLERILADPTKR